MNFIKKNVIKRNNKEKIINKIKYFILHYF